MRCSGLGFDGPEIGFDTKSGRLTVKRLPNGRLEMDFPSAAAARCANAGRARRGDGRSAGEDCRRTVPDGDLRDA